MATLLLAGMLTDTGYFQFTNDPDVLIHAGVLVKLGARKSEITDKIFRSKKFDDVRFWGEFLVNLKKDDKLKFFYTAVPFETYEKYGKPSKIASEVATMFGSIIKDLNFGMIMSEKDKGELDVSFRSKGVFDVSQIAAELGGGGHKAAAGGTVKGLPFDKAVEKVLEVARRHAAK
jgi:phosphoesterase RecJ-like protein